jgi:DNA-directed RNA polymerase subunit RPC12/RpoP
MNQTVRCLRCQAQMEAGIVPDNTQAGLQEQQWSPGEPEPSFWMGMKLKKDSAIPVRTWRCPKCGYLESYAIVRPNSEQ